jgi:cbb3-type cytochrome oxidase maturation protein
MGIIVILIFISLSIAVLFLAIFYWSMKSGQYDDTYTPSVRMLFDDKKKIKQKEDQDSSSPTTKPAPNSQHDSAKVSTPESL